MIFEKACSALNSLASTQGLKLKDKEVPIKVPFTIGGSKRINLKNIQATPPAQLQKNK